MVLLLFHDPGSRRLAVRWIATQAWNLHRVYFLPLYHAFVSLQHLRNEIHAARLQMFRWSLHRVNYGRGKFYILRAISVVNYEKKKQKEIVYRQKDKRQNLHENINIYRRMGRAGCQHRVAPIYDVSFKFVAQVHTVTSPLIEYE